MNFHDFTTLYQTMRRRGATADPAARFYAEVFHFTSSAARRAPGAGFAVEHNRSLCEWDWLRLGSPYFKVWPAMIPVLAGVNIEVPVEYLQSAFYGLCRADAGRGESAGC